MPPIRPHVKSRQYRVFTYQPVDRVPDIEFGYWPQTIRRWLGEGLPLKMTPKETEQMFNRKLNRFFGFDRDHESWFRVDLDMRPPFRKQVYERRAESVVMRDRDGIIAERYLNDSDQSSIPRYLEFPVKNPADWQRLKNERYRMDDPERTITRQKIAKMRQALAQDKAIAVFVVGFYGQMRYWMGTENLSTAFYDFPEMIEDMVDHWSAMAARQIESLPEDILIDRIDWWEDMAGKSGPLMGPRLFQRFLQPGYHRVMDAARQRGCGLGKVDCDGNPLAIVPNWLDEGVNIMFPLEVAAGVDPYAWRERFGRDLRLQGGVDKRALAAGGQAIDRELERIRPLLEQGGFIPHLDHLVPPDVSYRNYCEYLEKKRRLIGK